MKFAIQEDMLPGQNSAEKFAAAQALGLAGVEVWGGSDLAGRVPDIAEAVMQTGLPVSAVYHVMPPGCQILSPHERERESGLERLRDSITCACDLGAEGVILMPVSGRGLLPDLSPYQTAEELLTELLYTHLRTLEDFSLALGVKLFIAPVNRYETRLINRVDQAAHLLRRLKHPSLKIAADLFHMALEEADPDDALRNHAELIGSLHIADSNRRLPGRGTTDFGALGETLKAINYTGWVTFACGEPGRNALYAEQFARDLPACLDYLRQRGW
ncbi:MAG: sugar phosphate isomerase/epimerase [Anaerolinea sp.]|nr:sugar phosphate isomerase/epimerase [Anaerolinea sp.]